MAGKRLWGAWYDLLEDVPYESGVYCVWSQSKPLYIGTSRNLARRLYRHRLKGLFLKNGADMVTFVVFRSCENPALDTWHRYNVERWFIKTHKPPMNVKCVVS